FLWQVAPSLEEAINPPTEDSGGGGGPFVSGVPQSNPMSSSTSTQQFPNSTAPATPSTPLSPPPGAPSSSDLNALAHGVAGPNIQPPGTGPRPLTPPLGPGGGSAHGILAIGPDAGNAPIVDVYDTTTLQFKFSINAYDPSMTGGVRVAVGYVTGNSTPE